MYFKKMKVISAVLLSMLLVPNVFGQTSSNMPKFKLFGESYRPVPSAMPDKAQVVYYRVSQNIEKPSGANVYIDGRFHTSLLPGGFSIFCLPPGNHTLGAYQHDAPSYRGKTEELYRVNLEAGKTYFIKASDDGESAPVSVMRTEAERELKNTREQKHTVPRSVTLSCKN